MSVQDTPVIWYTAPLQLLLFAQEVLGDETANQVCCSFFGDGTCNVGKSLYIVYVTILETIQLSLSHCPCERLRVFDALLMRSLDAAAR